MREMARIDGLTDNTSKIPFPLLRTESTFSGEISFCKRNTEGKSTIVLMMASEYQLGLNPCPPYAVRIGGGKNHRMGLYDAVLIKDNHIALAGGIEKAIKKAKGMRQKAKGIEVEAKSILQVKQAIMAGADKILLDNMSIKTLRKAAKLCKKAKVWTEASGGINLKNVIKIAKTGVNAISVGALTHSAKALDISLEIV